MANRKITELTALTTPAVDDVLPIIDVSEGLNANKNKKITYGELFKSVINGTASAPSIAFDSSAATGFYRSAANELSITTGGTQRVVFDSTGNTTVKGDLVVQGTTTTVSSTTITVADKNLELATGQSNDTGADGGGLTIKGASDKTWNWINATDAWTSNQHIDALAGKVYKIGGAEVLSASTLGSAVINSSLTSVGTLGSLAVTNAITAGSLDISGGADIDGTMEADAYTVNGTALNEYIADTVGGMVSSNTETNITVTYDDSDNTLDFVIGTLNQDTTGNAATATALQTARTIGGVSFNGTANINLPGVNQTGNQNTTGSAATLTTARTIGGVSFDGSANINLPGVNAAGNQNTSGTAAGLSGTPTITVNDVVAASLDISGNADIDGILEADAYTVAGTALNEYIADTVGAMVSSNTETNISVTYDDSDNTLDFSVVNITGNAATATALQTARTIGGVSFDGSANITLPGVNSVGNQNTTGNAATSTEATNVTVTANNSGDGTVYPLFVGGPSGTQGAETDSGLNYNPFTGNLTSVLFTGNLTGNVTGNATTAAGLTGTPNITVADVVAASLDISGNADIDGTLEADAYTVNGIALNEYIADTVGGMVSSNTETNITVTYDDGDNTLDFVIGTLNQDTTGNAATATALETARTIGGVSFNGTANINLPGVNAVGNQNTTGSAATLTTARTIGGVSFDGSANINLPGVNAAGNQATSGNAATATKLATARAINGVDFDGTAAITVTAAAGTLTGATLASGVTASSLTSVGTLASLTTSGNVIVGGNLTVNGTQTIVNSTTISVDDKNLELGSVASPSDTTANGGGLTLKGSSDKTFNWVSSSAAWTSSEHLDLASGKVLKIAGTQVLSNTQYTGNAATATALATARTIGGVSFNGTANINLPGVNAAGNQNTSGTSAGLTGTPNITVGDLVAASLDISGNVDIDGTLETDALTINGTTLSETIADTVGAMVTSNTETGITVTYDDSDNTLDFVIGTLNQNTTGNAATATALATARTIGGVSFDGTANINLPGVNAVGTQNTSGNAATATRLETARAINGVNFDGTAAITVTAAAGTLTGNTLASGVTASSLTSVGTLTGLTVSGNISMTGTGAIDVPTGTTAQRPGSPTTGHFRYNSTEGEFEGYTASGWGAIAGGGGGGTDFRYLALRNAANNGAASYPAADFTLVTEGTTNALTPTAANALLVSYGGVLQRPNTGTSTPTTGFALSGSTIKFGSNIASAPDFIIYQLGAGVGTPSDNTVTSAKIVNGAIVNADINASAAIALSKLGTSGTAGSGNFLRGDGAWTAIDLTALNASNLTSGTVPDARFPSTLPAASGANLTALNGSNISSGTVATARLGSGTASSSTFLRGDNSWASAADSTKMPLAGGTFTGDVLFQGVTSGRDVLWDKSGNIMHFKDNAGAYFGDSTDLKIYHRSSDDSAVIENVNDTGFLRILSGDTDSSGILIKNANDDITYLRAKNHDGVELFFNNTLRAETVNTGFTITGTCTATTFSGSGASLTSLPAGQLTGTVAAARLDTATTQSAGNNSTKIATTAYADTAISNLVDSSPSALNTLNELAAALGDDANFSTTVTNSIATKLPLAGGTITGNVKYNDNVQAQFGTSSDLVIYHNGNHSKIRDEGTGNFYLESVDGNIYLRVNDNEQGVTVGENGAVELYHDNSKKLETVSGGVQITNGTLYLNDSYAARFGNDSDLQIYHESGVNNIDSNVGNLDIIAANNTKAIRVHTDATVDIGFQTDNVQLRLGAGSDLKLYHNSNISYIWDSGPNGLQIRSNSLYLCSTSGEGYLEGTANGATKIFYDNSTKLETLSDGVRITGHLKMNDSEDIRLGTSGDLKLYHDGSNSYIKDEGTGDLYIRNGSDNAIVCRTNNAVELYYDNSKKFNTSSSGVDITGELYLPDSTNIKIGNGGDLIINHNGTNSYINNNTGALAITGDDLNFENKDRNEAYIECDNGGAVKLFYNGSKHFETNSTGAYVTSRLGVASSVSVGTGSLQNASVASFKGSTYNQVNIAHSGNSGWGLLLTNSANSNSNYHRATNGGSACAIVVVDSESLHFATNNQARWSVHHNGHFLPNSNNSYDIGSTSYRVRNLYVNDAHFSNEGSSNSVDGTWGDWTLQEGEEDIFMINNRSGKKYRMALQEVH